MTEVEETSEWMTTDQVLKFKKWARSTLHKKVQLGLVIKHRSKGCPPMYKRSELTIDAIMNRAADLGLDRAVGGDA